MTELDINDAIGEVLTLTLTRSEIRAHDVVLETELSEDLPPIRGGTGSGCSRSP
jgi:hypothetical protein